jgi:serpin B
VAIGFDNHPTNEEIIKIYNSLSKGHDRNVLIAVGEVKDSLTLFERASEDFKDDSLEHKFERLILEYKDGSHLEISRKLLKDFNVDNVVRKGRVESDSTIEPNNNLKVNVVTVLGAWVHKFDPAKTHVSKFYLDEENSTDIDMMVIENELFNFVRLDDFNASAIELPYKYSDDSLVIILPDKKTGLKKLENNLARLNLTDISAEMRLTRMDVKIPRFEIVFDATVLLERQGKSNKEHPKLQDLLHLAVLKINEIGSETFTAIGIKHNPTNQNITDPDIQDFIADHPFLFLIKSKSKIKFIGRFVAP